MTTSTNQIASNFINTLFRGATEKYNKICAQSNQMLEIEQSRQTRRHKLRIQRAKNECDKAILFYKKVKEPLEKIMNKLGGNNFNVTSASLIRSRFLLSIQRENFSYAGILTLTPKGKITLEVFSKTSPVSWKTKVFSVQYLPRKNGGEIKQRNTFIRGVMNSIGGEANEEKADARAIPGWF